MEVGASTTDYKRAGVQQGAFSTCFTRRETLQVISIITPTSSFDYIINALKLETEG